MTLNELFSRSRASTTKQYNSVLVDFCRPRAASGVASPWRLRSTTASRWLLTVPRHQPDYIRQTRAFSKTGLSSVCMEFISGLSAWPSCRQRHFQTTFEDVFVCVRAARWRFYDNVPCNLCWHSPWHFDSDMPCCWKDNRVWRKVMTAYPAAGFVTCHLCADWQETRIRFGTTAHIDNESINLRRHSRDLMAIMLVNCGPLCFVRQLSFLFPEVGERNPTELNRLFGSESDL